MLRPSDKEPQQNKIRLSPAFEYSPPDCVLFFPRPIFPTSPLCQLLACFPIRLAARSVSFTTAILTDLQPSYGPRGRSTTSPAFFPLQYTHRHPPAVSA
jgi:hypothetical protein